MNHPSESLASTEDREATRKVLIRMSRLLTTQEMADALGISERRAAVLQCRYYDPNIAALPYAQTVELVRGAGFL